MSKIVITTVYFNLAHICKTLMYSHTLTHLHSFTDTDARCYVE